MDLRHRIELEAKQTVGYSEAENKESFMVGVNVSFSKTKEWYEREMNNLRNELNGYKSLYEERDNDLKNLASIIKRYTDDD